jgi:uncharacterized damage-inducible protein DinB
MSTTSTSAPAIDPKFATQLRDHYCDVIAMEIPITKRVLAAVPIDKKSYKPDEHARTAHELAEHIVISDLEFMTGILDKQFRPGVRPEGMPDSPAALADFYEQRMNEYMAKIHGIDGDHLCSIVPFYGMQFPAFTYLGFLQNHSVHHRGELATYLRPMGSKVPSIYGGSYDEPWQG